MAHRMKTEEFIERAIKVHGKNYIYSKVDLDNRDEKGRICIICPIHGEFWQTPYSHLVGQGCKKCGIIKNIKKRRYSTEDVIDNIKNACIKQDFEFISFCNKKGEETSEYKDKHTQIKLRCNKCGTIFTRLYSNLVHKEYHCPTCVKKIIQEKKIKPIEKVLQKIYEKCKEKKYDFLGFCDKNGNDINYNGVENVYLKLHCLTCENVWSSTVYKNFINGKGCPQCGGNKRVTEENAVKKLNEICEKEDIIFKGFVDKDKNPTKWQGTNLTFLHLYCKKCQLDWFKTSYTTFINRHYRCPNCNKSHLENELFYFFKEKNLVPFYYNHFYKFLDGLQLDFYFPDIKIAVECQGKQHFKMGGWVKDKLRLNKQYEIIEEHDERKRKLCEENGIKLLYYSNLGIDYPYKVYEDKEELLKEILKGNE